MLQNVLCLAGSGLIDFRSKGIGRNPSRGG